MHLLEGGKTTNVSYTCLGLPCVTVNSRGHMGTKAQKLYESMKDRGIQPDIRIFNALLLSQSSLRTSKYLFEVVEV